jgi:peptidoglycan L-alanyl-D-glutamate endopeptidase CwlK
MTRTYPRYPDLESAIEGTPAPDDIIAQLSLVEVDYLAMDSLRHATGQLVVRTSLAEDAQEIFGTIRDKKFPIQSIVPIVYFGHDDFASIDSNNTSAFNYRPVAGTSRLSKHALGTAIDLNPRLNPYMNIDGSPKEGSFAYPGYDRAIPGTITEGDVVVRAFLDRGWAWGGHWTDALDIQHFNKD